MRCFHKKALSWILDKVLNVPMVFYRIAILTFFVGGFLVVELLGSVSKMLQS